MAFYKNYFLWYYLQMDKIKSSFFSKRTRQKLQKVWPKLSPAAKNLILGLQASAKNYQKAATKNLISQKNVA